MPSYCNGNSPDLKSVWGRKVHVGSSPTGGAIRENQMFHNIVIGKPLVEPWELISTSEKDFEKDDRSDTLFTEERFLPAILVMAGVVPSRSEVRRNRPELWRNLEEVDCIWVKWGKHRIFIVIGE